MKLLFFLCLLTCDSTVVKEVNYTASTPAGPEVRNFLGISQADSIDFIRWHLKMVDQIEFVLACSYGISKPNTNGFIDEKKLALKGTVYFKDETLLLTHSGKSLLLQILNHNILHLLNKDGTMMVGNGGWSYTLNSTAPVPVSDISLRQAAIDFRDSIVFEGRTPCKGIEEMMT